MEINYENWKIVKKLGTGSFGSVYEIERNDFGVYKAALKVISIPQYPEEINEIRTSGMSDASISHYYSSMVEEIVSEFALMSKLKGMTNIVSYEDHQVIPHKEGIGWDIYIRMELLTPLDKYIQEHPLNESDVARLGIDICRALERCQKLNIIHRDIKPANIFISEQGDFKLGDFGIARTVERTASNMSRKGTTNYMAPEVFNGMEYGLTVDIYSLGLVMYRLLNHNRTPFLPHFPEPIKFQDQEMALFKRINGTPLPYPDNCSTPLGDVVLKACAYDPKDRFQSPSSFRHALERAAERTWEMTTTMTSIPKLEPTAASSHKPIQSAPSANDSQKSAEEKKGGNRKKLLGIIIAAVIVIIILLVLLLPKNDSQKESAVIENTTVETESLTVEITTAETTTIHLTELKDYTGRMFSDVQKELETEGLIVKAEEIDGTDAEGTVLKQSLASGTSVEEGKTITLTVSRGNQIKVPSFKNKSVKKVKSLLDGVNVVVAEDLKYDEKVTPGNVVSMALVADETAKGDDIADTTDTEESNTDQNTEASSEKPIKKGDILDKGATVKVYTGGLKIPENIVGMTEEEARTALSELGLDVAEENISNYDYSELASYGCVMSLLDENGNTLSPDTILEKGTAVSLQINYWVYQEPVYYEEPVYQAPVEPPVTTAPPADDGHFF